MILAQPTSRRPSRSPALPLAPSGANRWLTDRDGGVFVYRLGNPFMGKAVRNSNCASAPTTLTGAAIVQLSAESAEIVRRVWVSTHTVDTGRRRWRTGARRDRRCAPAESPH
jgi:hypothetical protein